jgi:hypothetical protein
LARVIFGDASNASPFGEPRPVQNDTGVVRGVVDGSRGSVLEILVGIGGEVDDEVRAGSNSTAYFYVDQDFTVGTVGVGRSLTTPRGQRR